ncbi:MAG: hypothetical protein K0A94_03915 [Desulfuromonadales bacterium]|nr:hypothetical protein [Desulfuromonadales bacterium]
MSIHQQPIVERIAWLDELARRHTTEFRSPDASLAREFYVAKYPTAIMVLKCMDGRINIPFATGTPPGIIQPFRNLGGMFDLGWPHLGEVLAADVHRMLGAGRQILIFITYHFSRGDDSRGCGGFDCNTAAALAHCRQIKQQTEYIFGARHGTIYPLLCGYETDEDALILHGADDELLDLSTLSIADIPSLEHKLSSMFPDMSEQMQHDLLPLLQGNIKRIAQVRTTCRLLDIEHREWMICLGRGFDFLHTPNLALIIGPYSPDLADPIRKAAGIIEGNMRAGRIPDDGFLLFTSVPYEGIGMDRARAELKSRFLADFAAHVIRSDFPPLAKRMHTQIGVLSWRSRALELLQHSP